MCVADVERGKIVRWNTELWSSPKQALRAFNNGTYSPILKLKMSSDRLRTWSPIETR